MSTLFRRHHLIPGCTLVFCAVAAAQQAATPAPQTPEPQNSAEGEPTRFVTRVNEVIVPVTVTDDKGRYVSNLEASDFRVLDEGKPQRIQFFTHQEKQPMVVGFLVDLSSSSRIHWKTYQDAIKELVWTLLPGDPRYSGYLISYSSQATLESNTTSDSDKITTRIDKMKPGGGAALFDALYLACTSRNLVKGEPFEPRRIIVVVGDGHDTASQKSLAEVLELAQRNLVTIFGLSTKAFGFATGAEDNLERLASATGGHVEYPLDNLYKDVSGFLSRPSDEGNYALTVGTGGYAAEISAGIMRSVGGISNEVTTQYILRYTPDVDPATKSLVYRRIKVEVRDLPGIKIYAREGYFPADVAPGLPPAAR